MRKKNSLKRWLAALALAAVGGLAWAQSYPSKPIQLVVAFAPGGTGDIVARMVAQKMGDSLGQPVVVENRPVPVAAVSMVAHARPDGYTLLMAGSGTALTSALFTKLPYDLMKDFIHVSTLATFDLALVTDRQSGFNSVADIIAFAKAHPGKLNIGTARTGSTQNLAAEMLKARAGIDVVIVPFKTTSDMVGAMRAKDVHAAIEMLPAIQGQISSKSVKALAVASSKRHPGLPEIPTLAESGMPGFEASSWNGIAVPAGTRPEVVKRLAQEIGKAIESPELQGKLLALGIAAKASTPEQMTQRMRSDIAKWRALIDKAGIPRQ
ncbi:tripartite tricarboxylate transporter substrate binding protein [Ramlibacter solisilvae]|uniref:TctC n=1 Tax=Ramlibacter tataouinensis TaxID=94132 RepID=A0A127JXR5_9BURK|nr:tripartite tricarboxylate transporter substrate-binding protein [Ramlibacter tataouinensis]AMO22852.1 TctC [Ramlibacter tataouinensis]